MDAQSGVIAASGVGVWGGMALGTGTSASQNTPVRALPAGGIARLSTGLIHTCAVTVEGKVWCWGRIASGIEEDGRVIAMASQPEPITFVDHAVEVASGWHFACIRDSGGVVSCWGDSSRGRLGTGNLPSYTGAFELDPICE